MEDGARFLWSETSERMRIGSFVMSAGEQVAFSVGGKRNRAARVGLSSANVRSEDDEAGRLEIT